ncbi:MAG: DUF2088 domain-containing protein [Deltaproteobacteria bacterium]|nr:DUF2088 domain-containing protein [Deltaproteobacteria bacterium]
MTLSISLAHGTELVEFHFLRAPKMLTVRDMTPQMDEERFGRRLTAYLNQETLDLRGPAIVVADKTRLCGYPQYLPLLLDSLEMKGAEKDAISIHIAYGTHERQSDDECRRVYGPAYERCRWVHHCCDDAVGFVTLGKTRRGTPVRFRSDCLAASCIITFGAISHHYFAGYGGGRKLLFPGLGEKKAIYANHGLFLDQKMRSLAPGCQPGVLDGNPLAEDLAEYEAFRPADMAIHGILDSHGRVCDLLIGRGTGHFRKACAAHGAFCEMQVADRFEGVLASCGGFPKDINFIQSHKAIHNAAAFVRDGGWLIVLAQCRDGIGSRTFLPWFEMENRDAAFDQLTASYVGNGGTALAMMAKLKRIRIGLVTSLAPSIARRIGFECLSASQVQKIVDAHEGALAIIPNASMLVNKSPASTSPDFGFE